VFRPNPADDKFKLVVKPLTLKDGMVYRFERIKAVTKMSLDYITWDNRLLSFGIEISPNASITEIIAEAQKGAEERLEDAHRYIHYEKGRPSVPPWNHNHYELKPKEELTAQITIVSRNGTMTTAVPKHYQDLWQNIAYQAVIDNPLVVLQTGPTELTAFYDDEFREIRVRFVQGAEGEENVVSLLPRWENQIIRVREAFGRMTRNQWKTVFYV
jgi:hypothetical protein